MSDAKAKPQDIFATVRARAVEYASRIPAEKRDRLAALAGAPAPGAKDDPAAACVAAAATPEGTRRILASIDRDARDALLLFFCGSDVLDELVFEGQVREFFGWTKARTRMAIETLFASGLLARPAQSAFMIDSFPALRLGLGPDLLVWLAGGAEDAQPVMPFARRLALLVAYAHAAPPSFTAGGALTVRWTDRAQEVFAATGYATRFLAGSVGLLGRTGAISPDPSDPEGKTWRVEPRWQETFRATPADLALAFADTTEVSPWGTPLGTLALLERARHAGEERPSIARLAEIGKAWLANRAGEYVPYYEGQFRPLAVASAVRTLRTIGLVSLERVDGTLRVVRTPASAPPPRPFRCTVLPTFEIWVAENADPAGTAELGRIADLASTDHVARFTLSQKSVARAASEPGGAAAAIERLAAAAEHGLPDNVRATLEGWTRRATLIRAYRGATVVTATEEQATFMRGRTGVVSEIAAGVFHVETDALTELLRMAEKAGHPLAPVVRDARPGAARRDLYVESLQIGTRAEDVRERLADWAKPSPPKAATAPGARPVSPMLARFVAPEELATDEPLTFGELRQTWPAVAAAVRAKAPILWTALRLPVEQLDDFEQLDNESEIRIAIAQYTLDNMPREPETPIVEVRAPIEAPLPTSAPGEAPWITSTAGGLVQLLAGAAYRKQTLDIVYIGPSGGRAEWRILPIEVLQTGQREWLRAKVSADGSTNRFELDRIAAVRAVEA